MVFRKQALLKPSEVKRNCVLNTEDPCSIAAENPSLIAGFNNAKIFLLVSEVEGDLNTRWVLYQVFIEVGIMFG